MQSFMLLSCALSLAHLCFTLPTASIADNTTLGGRRGGREVWEVPGTRIVLELEDLGKGEQLPSAKVWTVLDIGLKRLAAVPAYVPKVSPGVFEQDRVEIVCISHNIKGSEFTYGDAYNALNGYHFYLLSSGNFARRTIKVHYNSEAPPTVGGFIVDWSDGPGVAAVNASILEDSPVDNLTLVAPAGPQTLSGVA